MEIWENYDKFVKLEFIINQNVCIDKPFQD